MTEYQKIENALIPLGWTPEHRNGDHIRFSKEGITQYITVYKNITDKGRALQNAYAEIRRVEPRFPLGRQAHMLGGEETNTEPIVPEGVPSWMVPGRTVRWTAPEQRDWTKLSDPHSVMNKEYVINGFAGEGDEARVILFDPEHGIEFPVPQQDLDRWETAACERCGTTIPLNRLSRSLDSKIYCEDCVNRIILENNAAGKPAMEPPKEPARVEDPLKNLAELKNSQDARMRQLHDLFLEAEDIERMSTEQKQDLMKRTKEVIAKLSNSTKKSLRKKFPRIMEYFDEPGEKTTPKTPYEAWKNALNDLLDFNLMFNPDGYSKGLERQLKKALFGSSYTITQLRGPKDKRKTAARLITITTGDWDTTHRLWTGTEILFRQFREALPDLPLYILIHSPKADFHQYAADTARFDSQEDVATSLLLLESMLPESERTGLTRAIGNLALPYIGNIHDEIMRRAETAKVDFKEGCGVKLEADTINPDSDDYETAPPIYVATLLITTQGDPGSFTRLAAQFGSDKPFDAPIRVHIIDWYGNQTRTYEYNLTPAQDTDSGEPAKTEHDTPDVQTRHLIMGIYEDVGRYTVEHIHDTLFDRQKLVLSFCSASEDEYMRGVYRDALSLMRKRAEKNTALAHEWKELTGCDIHPEKPGHDDRNDNDQVNNKPLNTPETMPQNDNILDQSNPTSRYPFLATVSTRDLLKELKSRGVEFDNLTITVKKSIDINDI